MPAATGVAHTTDFHSTEVARLTGTTASSVAGFFSRLSFGRDARLLLETGNAPVLRLAAQTLGLWQHDSNLYVELGEVEA